MDAIETHYKGYRFRSRLEARWAVFFDALHIRYRYETEGFVLSDGTRYLPDFWLPDIKTGVDDSVEALTLGSIEGIWVEIKGQKPSREELQKAARLSGRACFVIWGSVPYPSPSVIASSQQGYPVFSQCHKCGGFSLGIGSGYRVVCPYCASGLFVSQDQISHWNRFNVCQVKLADRLDKLMGLKTSVIDTPALLKAYSKARAARFEFGETYKGVATSLSEEIEPNAQYFNPDSYRDIRASIAEKALDGLVDLVIRDPDRAARREMVARLTARGMSQREIVEALPSLGFVNKDGTPFALGTINRDLQLLRGDLKSGV